MAVTDFNRKKIAENLITISDNGYQPGSLWMVQRVSGNSLPYTRGPARVLGVWKALQKFPRLGNSESSAATKMELL